MKNDDVSYDNTYDFVLYLLFLEHPSSDNLNHFEALIPKNSDLNRIIKLQEKSNFLLSRLTVIENN